MKKKMNAKLHPGESAIRQAAEGGVVDVALDWIREAQPRTPCAMDRKEREAG
jgi:hypothetical protein